jgi:cbb3-type cytochrome oxidase subunit 3
MSLTDLMSGADLSRYAVIALVLFFAVFVALAIWIFLPGKRAWWHDAARLPLTESSPTSPEAP